MDEKTPPLPTAATPDPTLMARIRDIWEASRQQAIRSVNSAHVCANWLIGKQIVEAEQGGEQRAAYGKALLKSLSQQLTDEYGSGFSETALKYMRLFFLTYPDLLGKSHALRDQLPATTTPDWQPGQLHTGLSWTHYRILLKVERQEARQFYEIETIRNGWSARQLERQISSLLFDRLQLYVNYYDREIATTDDNPTIGLILCTEKNDAVVRYVLGEHNQQIFASRYQLHLPTEEQLQQELRREMDKLTLPDGCDRK